MKKKNKILIINASSSYGGVSSLLYNYYIHMDKTNLSFDFLSPKKSSFELKEKEITSNGDSIYGLNIKKTGIMFYIELCIKLKKFLRKKNYDVIHINSGITLYNAIVSYVSRKTTTSKIIVHSHSAYKRNYIEKIIDLISKQIIKNNSNYFFACSIEAAEAMFSKKIIKNNLYKIINNGINPNNYKYNEKKRNKIRKELGITKKCVVLGNVARLTEVKNQKFLIKLMEELSVNNEEFKLLIIGDGELKEELKEMVEESNLVQKVIFTGLKENVNDFYNAMDIFLLPSFSEGFGLTALEAQTNGLYCLVSDGVPSSINITPLITREKLDRKLWLNKILYFSKKLNHNRNDNINIIKKSDYNILIENKKLKEIYLKIGDKEEK